MIEVTQEQIAKFRAASNLVYLRQTERGDTIGVQSERMLHLILKHYLVPDTACHEVKIGRYWADAMVPPNGIYEIQTRRLDRLKTKLETFLKDYDVTVVYPIAATKILAWIDPKDGSMSKPRKSSVHRTVYDIFYELFFIKEYLNDPHFHFRAILCEMEEFRSLTGYGKQKKKRAPRMERIPTALLGEAYFETPADYAWLIPESLGDRFVTPDFAKATKLPSSAVWRAMQVLQTLGLVREIGREGHAKAWERVSPKSARLYTPQEVL